MDKVVIHTDGACRGNPGPGGWGAILASGNHEKELYGAESETTNNRMELIAAIMALESLKRSCDVTLATDSVYLKKGMTEWLRNWKRRDWKTSGKKPVKNKDLWQRLEKAVERHRLRWRWIKGHSGHPENERADQLANRAIDEMLS
ncbi:MAG: ribonuclease HI [Gammaproteobacteria bacterium]|jgi:ribonuclease HI|nr:ribonuclease HI [Gammaproteobacteria bacterium]